MTHSLLYSARRGRGDDTEPPFVNCNSCVNLTRQHIHTRARTFTHIHACTHTYTHTWPQPWCDGRGTLGYSTQMLVPLCFTRVCSTLIYALCRYKGYGLGVMVEMLSGVLAGSAVGPRLGMSMNPNAVNRTDPINLGQCFGTSRSSVSKCQLRPPSSCKVSCAMGTQRAVHILVKLMG